MIPIDRESKVWEIWLESHDTSIRWQRLGNGNGLTAQDALEHWYTQHPAYWGKADLAEWTIGQDDIMVQPETNRSDISLCIIGGGHTPTHDPFKEVKSL
jgi:hypothetical protein